MKTKVKRPSLCALQSSRALNRALTCGRLLLAALLPMLFARADLFLERTLREYQARYHYLTGAYVEWPHNYQAPAPHFPPDGFYGDPLKDPDLGVIVVQNLSDTFLYTKCMGSPLYVWFAKTSDGQENIEGCSSVPTYTADDFLDLINAGLINRSNYVWALSRLREHIRSLKWLNMFSGFGFDGLEERNGYAGAPQFGDAKALAAASWANSAWTDCQGYPACRIKRYEYIQDYGEPYWYVKLANVRGRVQVDLTKYPNSQAYLYLLVNPLLSAYPPPPCESDVSNEPP